MGWWIALGILILLAILPLGASIRFQEGGLTVRIIGGPIRFTIVPKAKKKEKKPGKKQKRGKEQKALPAEEAQKTPPPEQPAEDKKPEKTAERKKSESAKKGGSVLDFLPLVKLAMNLLGEFFGRKLRINVLELKLVMAGDDPCDLAQNYGRAWAALGNLWPRLEEMLVIKKRDIQVECDFTGTQTLVYAYVELTITLGRLVSMLVRYGVRALIEYLKIRKKRKGGADHESNSTQYA